MAIEVGKSRLEALGDVEETADLIRYYCDQFEANDGLSTRWATSAIPPSTLDPSSSRTASGPSSAPSTSRWRSPADLRAARSWPATRSSTSPRADAPLLRRQAGRDRGPGRPAARRVQHGHRPGRHGRRRDAGERGIDGLLFTGSYEIGFEQIFKTFSKRFPKPVVVEMGGKEPSHRQRPADLEEAAEGIIRSAFGFAGQKCSACSRVYVEAPVLCGSPRATRGQGKGAHHRRPDRAQGLARPAGECRCRRHVRCRGRRGEAGRPDRLRRRTSQGHAERSVRGAHDRGRPAVRAPHLAR